MNHFQSKCKQHRYVKQVQAAVCSSGNEYNVGTLSVFSVGNRRRAYMSVSPRRLEELRAATASDCALQKLMQVTMKSWPAQKSGSNLDVRAYYNVRHELTVQNGLVLTDCRIVVPTSLRKNIIATVHRSHQGIQGYIRLARDAVYWPLMNQEITDYMSQCSVCNIHRPEQCT